MAASKESLELLHSAVAHSLNNIIKNGLKSVDKDGNVSVVPAPAAYIAAAIKFLTDNHIEAKLDADSPLAQIAKSHGLKLPFEGSLS